MLDVLFYTALFALYVYAVAPIVAGMALEVLKLRAARK